MEEHPVNVLVCVWEWNIRITICSCLISALQCLMAKCQFRDPQIPQCIILSMLVLQVKHLTCENSLFIMLFISVEIPDIKQLPYKQSESIYLIQNASIFWFFIRISILKDVQNLTPHRTYLSNMEKIFSYVDIFRFLPTVELLWMFFSHDMESVSNWSILTGKRKPYFYCDSKPQNRSPKLWTRHMVCKVFC